MEEHDLGGLPFEAPLLSAHSSEQRQQGLSFSQRVHHEIKFCVITLFTVYIAVRAQSTLPLLAVLIQVRPPNI